MSTRCRGEGMLCCSVDRSPFQHVKAFHELLVLSVLLTVPSLIVRGGVICYVGQFCAFGSMQATWHVRISS